MSRVQILSLFLLFSCASSSAFAQQPNNLWARIEASIRQREPEWTLMDIYPKPQTQQLGLFRWKLDENEIFAWIIVQPSVAKAVFHFQEDGFGSLPGKSPVQKLDIGDASYVRSARGNTIVVFRRDYVLTRVSGRESAIDSLVRFARHINAALGTEPPKPKTAFERGETALKEGRYEEAIEELRRALNERESDLAKVQHALGLAYLKLDRREEAIASFKEATRLRPTFADAHYELGRAYYETGEFLAAAASFEEAIRLNSDFFDALVGLGKTYQHSGLHTKSVEAFRKATLLRPDAIDTKSALGAALLFAGQPEDAAQVLQEVVRLSPQSAFAYSNLGRAYRLMDKFQAAFDALQEALRINPEDSVAHNNLGLTYESLERPQEALASYKHAIALKPDYAEAHYNSALLHLALGDRNQAQSEYNILKRLNSDLADVLLEKMVASKR